MLMQPTIEKLHSMKLFGMAEAIRRQTEDPEISRSASRSAWHCWWISNGTGGKTKPWSAV